MQSTGIVPRRPTTAWDVPNASWIEGISGPTPTIWGRSVSAARKSATRVAVGRLVTFRRAERARVRCREASRGRAAPSTSSWKCGARGVRIERCLVGVPLEDEEAALVVRVAVRVVLEAAGLGARERHQPPQQLRHRVALALVRHPAHGEDDGHAPALFRCARISLAETSTCLRASRPAALALPERIASISFTWRSAACSGSM